MKLMCVPIFLQKGALGMDVVSEYLVDEPSVLAIALESDILGIGSSRCVAL
ncbi:hypothetical protein HYC85_006236 [Camellia sinensis]|uniref:Uncharacterized protein n=1 Tax=Camellia sinensis TaxID=4442 RepID=A0A7J7HKF3_CAMSI|nr:hypothetical protein HYC85_006236 [Camellia sinensis]